jgi:LysR family nitrogen assimilation transcriptional regulator
VNEGASERLVTEVLSGELAQAVVTEPVQERRLLIEKLLDEALVGVVPEGVPLPDGPIFLDSLLALGLGFVLPPAGNPLRTEVDHAAAARKLQLPVVVEVEGIRLVSDLVAAGAGCSVLPETAVPTELHGVRTIALTGVPPRRLALVSARDSSLSLADRAVRECVRGLVAARPVAINPVIPSPDSLARTLR